MNLTTTISACPFCASKSVAIASTQKNSCYKAQIQCLECGACGPVAKDRDRDVAELKCIASWNGRRTKPTVSYII